MCMEFDLLDWQPVVVDVCLDREWVAHVVLEDFALLSSDEEVQRIRLEFDTAYLLRVTDVGRQLGSAVLLVEVPELDLAIHSTNCNRIQLMTEVDTGQLLTQAFEWTLKSTKVKVQSVNFICGPNSDQIAGIWLVDHVSAEFWYPYLEVAPVLRMELDVPVCTEEGNFGIVSAKRLKLDDLGVDAPFALHGQVGCLEDLDFWRIHACCHHKVSILANAQPLAADWVVQVLDEINAGCVVLKLLELDLPLLGLLHVLWKAPAT